MKAIVYHAYGLPDVLELQEMKEPIPKANEVLLKVHAASVNSWDWDLLRGKPFLVRLAGGGIQKPNFTILGADVSGVVEKVGANVKQLKPGDAVMGDLSGANWGAFAEYVCAPESVLTLKPTDVSFESAAALPQAGVMAWQGIHDYVTLQPGSNVLINGAAGGVGTYAIQLAKMLGAHVTAVDRGDKLPALTSLGADHVIDYTEQDFTKIGRQFDLILDVVANRSIWDYKRALLTNGMYLMIGGQTSSILQCMLLGRLSSMNGRRKVRILIHSTKKNLDFLATLLNSGKLKSAVHKCYSLSQVPEALRCIGNGNAIGKLVIRVVE